ncbi:hypothetical protein [uncultured Croceitalea sp.]|uniref:hypothetical protein n=1 Tax=uncultured Croceitalea sp. TaxID=1798908 RepID=UPI003305710F
MTKKLQILAFLFTLSICNGQIRFEKGYIIDNTGTKTECYIKNSEWRYNPIEFEYKLTETGSIEKGESYNIREFTIPNVFTFLSSDIKIDKSSSDLKTLSQSKNPNFEERKVFLKLLVRGDASLFEYKDSNASLYFFKPKESEITQLIYKKYSNSEGKIAENTTFRSQLWDELKCEDISLEKTRFTRYNKKELISFFSEYNLCSKSENVIYSNRIAKDWFKLRIKSGINSSSVETQQLNSNPAAPNDRRLEAEFDKNTSITFGLEAEFILPFNRNKWSFFIQPLYRSYNSSSITGFPEQEVLLDYNSIETFIGIRHYVFFSSNSKLFFNAATILDSPLSSIIDYENSNDVELQSTLGFSIGLGFMYNDKISIEFNYIPRREILENFLTIGGGYDSAQFILAYRIF